MAKAAVPKNCSWHYWTFTNFVTFWFWYGRMNINNIFVKVLSKSKRTVTLHACLFTKSAYKTFLATACLVQVNFVFISFLIWFLVCFLKQHVHPSHILLFWGVDDLIWSWLRVRLYNFGLVSYFKKNYNYPEWNNCFIRST